MYSAAVLDLNRVLKEEAGEPYYAIQGLFRCYRGIRYMDIERKLTIRKDGSDWIEEIEEERHTLMRDPHGYDSVIFLKAIEK